MFMSGLSQVTVQDMDDYLQYVGGPTGAVALTAVAAVSAYYLASRPKPMVPPVDLRKQSELKESPSGPEMMRVSWFAKDCRDGKFMKYLYDDAKTLYEAIRRGARESNNGNCLGWREASNKPYQWLTYNESLLRAKNFGSGLIALGLKPGTGTFIGIYSGNCPEWILTEQGLYCYSMVIIPLYDTLGPDACSYIINQADMSTVICQDEAKAKILLDKRPGCLKRLICIKDFKPELKARAESQNIEVIKFEDVEKLGAAHAAKEIPPNPSDLATVCYTSGTTGNPKGVMLTHENIVSDVCAVLMQLQEYKPNSTDIMMSFLPLAHMLERCCEVAMYMEGAAVGFYMGDIRKLMDDMKALKPTVSPTVPRLLNRIYDKVYAGVNGSIIKKGLLRMALNSKMAEIKRGVYRNNSIWDKVVFKKVQEGMGGKLRLMVVGSAPLAGHVLSFMRCALGCVVVEGYGQTECVAPCTLTMYGDAVPDHVGPPIPCCAIKLSDVPEMGYYATGTQGEVCVRGPNVFQGYFKDPERTKDTIDADGWLHTGDIGTWLPNGCLKIIDRKKHIFKLSQGEYIAPEKIESIYVQSTYVAQVFIHGESLKSCIVAILVPDVESVKNWAAQNGIPGTLSVLCANPDVKKMIIDDITELGKNTGLKSFEQVKDVYLHPDPFSIQNGLLTPTLKNKRPELKSYFKPQLEDMYSKLV